MKFSGAGSLNEILNVELFVVGDESVTVGAMAMAAIVMSARVCWKE